MRGTTAAKKNILITGQPGCGKTTLISRICARLKEEYGLGMTGFYTEEVRGQGGERVGFDVVTLDGARGTLSRTAPQGGHRKGRAMVGNYEVDVSQFEELALPTLQPNDTTRVKLIVIDEVGKMELFSEPFKSQVLRCLDQWSCAILGSVPMPRYGREIPFVADIKARSDVHLFHMTKSTRDEAYQQVLSAVIQALPTLD